MEIDQILNRLQASKNVEAAAIKTASAAAPTSTDALRGALRDALATQPATEKTAAVATDPTGDLLKFATDLSNAEHEALTKQAAVYGAAMCDGFMSRFTQYDEAAGQVAAPIKTAGTAVPADFQKFAQENPQLVQEAYDLGYQTKIAALQKQAQEEFEAGYNDTLNEVHKVASEIYKQAAYATNNVIRQAQAQG